MFITFEGPDGSGKTTAISKISDWLKSNGHNFVLTKEPGSAHLPVNKKIRSILVDAEVKISGMTEAILFSADRRSHLEEVIWPALDEKRLVLCDRYFDSTFAYQGSARNLGVEKMINLQENITNNTYPDITFYFDLPLEQALSRVDVRGGKNRLDSEKKEFYQKVQTGYNQIINMQPKRFRIIDASKTPEEVFEQVKQIFINEII